MLAIIQARLGSKRLPGKVARHILGKQLIVYLLDRLALAGKLHKIYLAVPAKDLADFICYVDEGGLSPAAYKKIRVIGCPDDEWDVLRRFRYVLSRNPSDIPPSFIRICADSPLIDPALIDWMIDQYNGTMLTNTKPRTFPAGQCIEIIPTKGFVRGVTGETDEDREHVTPWIYRHFNYTNVTNPLGDFSHVNMCVDTQADFDRIKATIEKMDRPHTEYGWREIVELMA